MNSQTKKKVDEWLQGPYDEKTKAEIRALMKKDPEALEDAFYTDLVFGTGGLRGLMGPGTNRMNIYTVRNATQGLANYILKQKSSSPHVLIGFDSRHNSIQFALEAARVLAGNKIKVFLLKELRPTPYISFACREKKCQAAIMITASHNPKEYNGYKVYWSDGGQVVPPHDVGIIQEAEKVREVKLADENDRLIQRVDGELDKAYLKAIHSLQHFPKENQIYGSRLKISYTSLHGTGITIMPEALSSWGFMSVNMVGNQIIPDGDFPTVKFPNPEFPETLKLGIQQLVETGSDILIATDPDADRLAAAVHHKGQPVILSGNEIASICVYFLCEIVGKKGAFVTTIVSTELLKTIAEAYGNPCFEVLTGFKYIGEKIHEWEFTKKQHFLFGAEESCGFLLGTHARDKDAISSGCFLAEIALHMKNKDMTLVDLLHEIYKKFGVFREGQKSLTFKAGKEGSDQIVELMIRLRKELPKTFASHRVLQIIDYEKPTDLPRSDVLLFRLSDESKLVIRPSGTEPKIKIYGGVRGGKNEEIESCDERLEALLKAACHDLR